MNDLITPRDWQHIAQQQAIELLGTPEADAKQAEAKRYGMLADEIDRLRDGYKRIRDSSDSEMMDGDLARDIAVEMLYTTNPTESVPKGED